ncbi:MAG: type 1 glutamine amidotransferase [Candidatus Tectomicrobia bacterium]|nr:type 1 glutamine amidotransferase [Candidatus Tectomicrobia bacterium]
MPLSGKTVAVLAENLYQEMELWYPVYRFREAGAVVHVIGTGTAETYTSKHGYPVKVDSSVDEVSADDYDAVIIPGGYAPDLMRRKAAMVEFVRKANEQGKIVAAICHAGWMLCSADIVRGRTATCFHSIRDDLIHAGARYVNEEVVVDGNLITSRFPDDLPAFCREVIRALAPVAAG